MNKKEFIKKRDEESVLGYMARLYRHITELGCTSKELNKIINSELGTSYAESSTRCNSKSYNIGREEGIREYAKSDNEAFKELEDSKLELKKLKIQYQDQRRIYESYVRSDSRFEHLKDELMTNVQKLNEIHPLYTFESYKQNKYDVYREACLMISDVHLGMVINDSFNKYDMDVAKIRFNYLRDKVIEYCTLNNVSVLHVELLGDLPNGYIHTGTRINNEEDVISQIIDISELLSNFLHDISKYISAIEVYSTIGNHGRCMSIKDNIQLENFERLIPWYLETRLKDCGNVEIIQTENKDDIIVYDIINEKIFACHGHKDKLGTIVDDLSKFLKVFPSEVHVGHYHAHKTTVDSDITLVVNGSFCGTDEYAESIRKRNNASQTLIIYNEKGQECLYNIKL